MEIFRHIFSKILKHVISFLKFQKYIPSNNFLILDNNVKFYFAITGAKDYELEIF